MEFLQSINLNYIIIFLISIYIMHGFLKGFLVSIFHTIGMGVSWIVGFFFSPMLSENIASGTFYSLLKSFTESSDRLKIPTDANLIVSTMTPAEIDRVVSTSDLPMPFDTLVQENMTNAVFESQGYHTVADYMNMTIANVTVNIISFLIIYLISRVIISLLIDAYNFASPVPMLRHCDGLAGGGVAFVRGYMGMFSLFIIVPVLLVAMPLNLDIFHDLIYNSSLATYFYESNFLLQYVSGVI